MLPNASIPSTSTPAISSTIHINPKFRNVHINPSFLGKTIATSQPPAIAVTINAPTQIYINPKFLSNQIQQVATTQSNIAAPLTNAIHSNDYSAHFDAMDTSEQCLLATEPLADTKIHTRTKIIHASRPITAGNAHTRPIAAPVASKNPLIKLSSKKLIRASSSSQPVVTKPTMRRPLQTKYKIVKEQSTFKIDRRTEKAKQIALVERKQIATVARKPLLISEQLVPVKAVKSPFNISPTKSSVPSKPSTLSTKTAYLYINGIRYKSSRRKLEKTATSNKYSLKTPTPATPATAHNGIKLLGRVYIVRGENFLLDESGKRLTRISNATANKENTINNRIDIGKLTFVKKSNNTFERTDFHKSRYHLNVAKQRSIQMLTSQKVKTNVPCPIFRKLGKCAAFERKKCSKLHDKKLVDVCPRFLRGTCDKKICLLSHDITLSKMPTCKFYLLGECSKTDCKYLHKKLNEKTEICNDFLKGYCEKAEECSKRHEFLCPEYQSKGSCKLTRCPYPHGAAKASTSHTIKRKIKATKPRIRKTETETSQPPTENQLDDASTRRYFCDDSECTDKQQQQQSTKSEQVNDSKVKSSNVTENVVNEDEKLIVKRKPMLGPLPSFIPLG